MTEPSAPITAPSHELGERLAEHGVDAAALTERAGGAYDTGDGRLVVTDQLLEGRVLTHRVTSHELVADWLVVHPDLSALAAFNDRFPTPDGGRLEIRKAAEHPDLGLAPGGAALTGPEGWLGGFSAGDVVAVHVAGGALRLERVEAPAPDPALDVRGVEGQTAVAVALRLLADHTDRFQAPEAPLADLLAGAGLGVTGDRVARLSTPAGATQGAPGVPGLSEPAVEALNRVTAAFNRLDRPDAVDAAQLGRDLSIPDVASSFAEVALGGTDPAPEPTARLVELAEEGGAAKASLHFLRARLSEHAGDLQAAEEHLRDALRADAKFGPAAVDAAWYASDRGEASRAATLLMAGRVDPDDSELTLLRRFARPGPAAAGRNDPCPCGSGKKYKACHLRQGGAGYPLPDRVVWLHQKAVTWAERPTQRGALVRLAAAYAGLSDPAEDPDRVLAAACEPALVNLFLFDAGHLADFVAQRGPLLPSDEAELVETWVGRRHELFRQVRDDDGSWWLEPEADGDRIALRAPIAKEAPLVLAVPVSTSTRTVILPPPIAVPEAAAERLRSTTAAEELAAAIGEELGWTAPPVDAGTGGAGEPATASAD